MAENDPRTTDPDGRLVVFDAGTRLHLALGRPELVDEHEPILGAVAHPDYRIDDDIPGREHFYRRHVDPRRWLRVVVDFNLNVRHILEHDGRLTLTLPPEHLEADALEPILAAA